MHNKTAETLLCYIYVGSYYCLLQVWRGFFWQEVGIYDSTASWENYYIQSVQVHRASIPSTIIHLLRNDAWQGFRLTFSTIVTELSLKKKKKKQFQNISKGTVSLSLIVV